MYPVAHRSDLIVEELPDEVIIYSRTTERAHCLNRTAYTVWTACDGRHDIPALASHLQAATGAPEDERLVWLALYQLRSAGLLADEPALDLSHAGTSRRQVVRALGLVGALSVIVPSILSLSAPTPARASYECAEKGTSCLEVPCCDGECNELNICE